jgi:hypothetical protein
MRIGMHDHLPTRSLDASSSGVFPKSEPSGSRYRVPTAPSKGTKWLTTRPQMRLCRPPDVGTKPPRGAIVTPYPRDGAYALQLSGYWSSNRPSRCRKVRRSVEGRPTEMTAGSAVDCALWDAVEACAFASNRPRPEPAAGAPGPSGGLRCCRSATPVAPSPEGLLLAGHAPPGWRAPGDRSGIARPCLGRCPPAGA